MNWDAIGAVGEILGALAVVITLVYLSIQLRQNTKALHSTATQSAHDQTTGAYRALSLEESLADIWVRGVRDPDSLSDTEIVRFLLTGKPRCYQCKTGITNVDRGIWTRLFFLAGARQ